MTTLSSYIPNGDADRGIWLNNFNTKLPTYASTLGISPAEVTTTQQDTDMFGYVMNMLEAYKQTANNITSYKNLLKHAEGQQHLGALPVAPVLSTPPVLVPEGVFDRIAKLVKRIKASTNYTNAIGQDLGIITATQLVNPTTMQPELKISLDAGRPHIRCAKGNADAIDLYVDRKDGAGYVLIGRLLKPDYIDTVNLAANTVLAEWDYKAMYVIGNSNVGLMSAVVSIIVKAM